MNSGKDPVGWRKLPTGDKIKRVQTFICFSIVSGDRKRIREVHSFLTELLLDFVLLSYLLILAYFIHPYIHCIHSLVHSFSEPLNPTTNNGDFSCHIINHDIHLGVAFGSGNRFDLPREYIIYIYIYPRRIVLAIPAKTRDDISNKGKSAPGPTKTTDG